MPLDHYRGSARSINKLVKLMAEGPVEVLLTQSNSPSFDVVTSSFLEDSSSSDKIERVMPTFKENSVYGEFIDMWYSMWRTVHK